MTAKTRAITAAAGALALLLSGCTASNQEEGLGESTQSPETAASAPTTSAAPTPSPSPSPTGTEEAPEFVPVKTEEVGDAQAAQIAAFEAVQLHYETLAYLNRVNERDKAILAVAAKDPWLRQLYELMEPLEGSERTYTGQSKPELISAEAGGLSLPDGERILNGAMYLLVCEDNTDVRILDEDGEPVDTGMPRYMLEYTVTWDPETTEWKVMGSGVERESQDGPAKSC